MTKEWQELTRMTQGKPITVERVRLVDSDIAIEGSFTLPPLANLENMFGISYPTVKNRLNRIARQLEFVEIVAASPQEEVISELERGEITAEEAIRRLSS
jgi:hypothetical protein